MLTPAVSGDGLSEHAICAPTVPDQNLSLIHISFLILPLGAKFASDAGIVSVSWLVASYGLQSIGELMISGLGLAMRCV